VYVGEVRQYVYDARWQIPRVQFALLLRAW